EARAVTAAYAGRAKKRFLARLPRLRLGKLTISLFQTPSKTPMSSTMSPHPSKEKPALKVNLATPRGFCAGVDRAIQIVERALELYGAPVYVRHEIVHNKHVVDRLKGLGAVFVKELEQCPPDRPVVFSAHGV